MSKEEISTLAKMIDHTNLKPDSTLENIKNLCEEAEEYNFGAVCVNPYYVKAAYDYLKKTDVKICTVIGFPLGASILKVKTFEINEVIKVGASEIDIVLNIGALKSGNLELVKNNIEAMVIASEDHITKVILETCYLTEREIIRACHLVRDSGADFVKTSTGFGPKGATEANVILMRNSVGNKLGVKASGGIRDYKTVKKMIEAGANRIGTSSSVQIIEEYKLWLSKN